MPGVSCPPWPERVGSSISAVEVACPRLVIAAARPDLEIVLLDASERRTDWLVLAVTRLGWTDRIRVVTGRAEVLGRQTAWRASQDAVVARSFGPPLVTAECAVPFLRLGGVMVVSEPPHPSHDRWPSAALAELGLEAIGSEPSLAIFRLVTPCPAAVPRTAVVRRR